MLNESKLELNLGSEEMQRGAVWYLDTEASNHMTGCRNMFSELDESVKGTVKFGDGSIVNICGRGTVLLECRNKEHKVLTDVYYIPNLCSNIVSIGQLDEHGCRTVVADGYLSIFDRQEKLLAKVKRSRNKLYIIDLHPTQPMCMLASFREDAWLWHVRYGHLNFQALRNLAHNDMVQGLSPLEHVNQLCDRCLVGKQC